jgi:hypothetical protein
MSFMGRRKARLAGLWLVGSGQWVARTGRRGQAQQPPIIHGGLRRNTPYLARLSN